MEKIILLVSWCFTSTEIIRLIRDGGEIILVVIVIHTYDATSMHQSEN